MVESYVMGLLSEAERQEFDSLCRQYPEIAEARNAFELELEARLLSDAHPAPPQLQQQIREKLNTSHAISYETEMEEERTPVRSMGAWKWIAAAALVLMAGAGYWAFSENKKYKEAQSTIALLEDSLQRVQQPSGNDQPDTQPKSDFKMAAIKEENASATIYWDTTSKDVYLMINNMPVPASNKQYQLWALLPDENAAPIDLGTIQLRQERILYRMKNVQNAKAFAITLEPKGGSPSPTTAPMISEQPVNL
ncbi:MAG: anti-sigma factor [Flavisolibacter sp.]